MKNFEKYQTAKERENAYKEYLKRTKDKAVRAGKFEWLSLEEGQEEKDMNTRQYYDAFKLKEKLNKLDSLGIFEPWESQFLLEAVNHSMQRAFAKMKEEHK